MAVPWTESRDQNTLTTIAVDGASSNVTQIINGGGEKILQELVERERIFMVPDAERFSHAILHKDAGSATVRYRRDDFGPGTAIGTDSVDIMTNAKFDILARTRNLNFPQDMAGGTLYNYMTQAAKSSNLVMFQELESEFLLGDPDSSTGATTPVSVDPYEGDDNSATQCMSFRGITKSSSGFGITGSDPTSASFAGINTLDYANWAPKLFSTAATGDITVLDIDHSLRANDFGPLERTTNVYMGLTPFNLLADEIRTKATHNDAMNANLGLSGKIQIGSAVIDWHRFLGTEATEWDYSNAVTSVACRPIMFMNLNSLRLNIVASGTISDGGYAAQKDPKIGFLKQFDGVHMHPAKNQMYKRVSMLSCLSLEHGRRGFAQMDNLSGLNDD